MSPRIGCFHQSGERPKHAGKTATCNPSAESVRSTCSGSLGLGPLVFHLLLLSRHSEMKEFSPPESHLAPRSPRLLNEMVDFLRERLIAFLSFSRTLSVEILLVTLVAGLCIWTCRWARQSKQVSDLKAGSDASNVKMPVITPLRGFNWKTTEPMQFRPFVGKERYNMTMGMNLHLPSSYTPARVYSRRC